MSKDTAPLIPPAVFDNRLGEFYADSFFVLGNPVLTRIAFGTARPDGEPRFDLAMRLPTPLIDDLIRVLGEVRDTIRAQEQAQAQGQEPVRAH